MGVQSPMQRAVVVLWPSFITAGLATVLFFTAFDPHELLVATRFAEAGRMAVYSVGFFLFWLLTAFSCWLSCFFNNPAT